MSVPRMLALCYASRPPIRGRLPRVGLVLAFIATVWPADARAGGWVSGSASRGSPARVRFVGTVAGVWVGGVGTLAPTRTVAPRGRGSILVSRGRVRAVAGRFRLRSLAGWSAGTASRPDRTGGWRSGVVLRPSLAEGMPDGVALAWEGPRVSVAGGHVEAPGGRAWAARAGGGVGPFRCELASGAHGGGVRREGVIGWVTPDRGGVLGWTGVARDRAVRVVLRQRLGGVRLRARWEDARGAFRSAHPLFGVPSSGWAAQARGRTWEVSHAAWPTGAGGRSARTEILSHVRRDDLGVRAGIGHGTRSEVPETTVRAALSGRVVAEGAPRIGWQVEGRAARRAEVGLASFVAARLEIGDRTGRAVIRVATSSGGSFWTAVGVGPGVVRPVHLRAGEWVVSLTLRRGGWEVVLVEESRPDGVHRFGGASLRW